MRALILAALLLAGCASPVPLRDEIVAHIRLVDRIDYRPGYTAHGLSTCANGICRIEVLRSEYPGCITHEVRHGFEGNWHPDIETTRGC